VRKECAAALAAIMILAALPAAMGADTMSGEATIGNATPEATNAKASAQTDVNVEYLENVDVQDNNKLSDLENVRLVMWGPSASEGDSDSERGHYTFLYDVDSDSWSEIGPDSATDSHINSANCVKPAMTGTSGTFGFAITLAKVAENGTWNLKFYAADNAGGTSSASDTTTVQKFIEMANLTGSVAWSDLSPGDENVAADGMPAAVDVTSNADYNVQLKLDGNWTSGSNVIGADNTKFNSTNDVTTSTVFSTTYQTLSSDQWTSSRTESMYFWLSVPNGTPAGTYANTFCVSAANA